MSSEVRIAISGKSGCGNSTVSDIVARKMNLRLINYTFKSIADELGIDFEEVCRRAETDANYDHMVDTRQLALAEEGSCVLGSRLAIWLLASADLRVYLAASKEVRARRILKREGGEYEDVLSSTIARDARDHDRYEKLYDIDVDVYDFADLVINTENYNPEQEADLIVDALKRKNPDLCNPRKS